MVNFMMADVMDDGVAEECRMKVWGVVLSGTEQSARN